MSTLITGGTGFLGSYVLAELLASDGPELVLFTRAKTRDDAAAKLWAAMQLHWDAPTFHAALPRIRFVAGDLSAPGLGLSQADRDQVHGEVRSVLHMAASLNRKSSKACFNHNLRGTLSMIDLVRPLADAGRLDRFSFVSTVAVAGHRAHEVVREDEAIDWDRSDYDPYGRTKKFCEHMVRTLLPGVTTTIFRPSTVLGDTRFAATSQFDMIRAVAGLSSLPVIPFDPSWKVDIVNADWVGHAIATVHAKEAPDHDCYHLSGGVATGTIREITEGVLVGTGHKRRFVPPLGKPFELAVRAANRLPRGNPAQAAGAVMKVFLPYVTYDTVFDNTRAVTELGRAPAPFATYAGRLVAWCREHRFRYPHVPLPAASEAA